MARRSASVVDGGIMFGSMAVEPTMGVSAETASCYGSNSVSVGQSEVSSIMSPCLTSFDDLDLDLNDQSFPLQGINVERERFDHVDDEKAMFSHNKHFFILSSAGKPIYSLHGSQDVLVVYSGIIQTIVSFYEYADDGEEEIKSIDAEDVNGNPIKICFLNKSPILYMAISTDSQINHLELNQQLEFLHNFLLATLSKPFIDKTFSKRANFDLRQVLGPTDIATLDSICVGLANGTIMDRIFGGLECLKMKQTTRSRLERKMLKFKSDNLLYALVVGPNGKLIDIMRPKKHTLHTSDLSILFEIIYKTNAFKSPRSMAPDSAPELATTVTSSSTANVNKNPMVAIPSDQHNNDNKSALKLTTNETYWLPLCLPKFNSTGHLYTLIQFHQMNDARLFDLHDIPNKDHSFLSDTVDEDDSKIGIIVITPYRDSFEEMKKVATGIAKSIIFDKIIWFDIWKGLLGSNRVVYEEVTKSMQKGVPYDLASQHVDQSHRERRGSTFDSFRSLFTGGTTTVPPPVTPNASVTNLHSPRVINSRESILSLNLLVPKDTPFHFVLKNKKLTQFVYPLSYKFNAQEELNKMKLVKLYSELRRGLVSHNSIPLRVIEWNDNKTQEKFNGLAAVISGYEVYIIGTGVLNQERMVDLAVKLVKWAKKEEGRLFISSGCVF